MARKPRIEYPGALFHIIARGNNQQDIFHDDEDRQNHLDRLAFYLGESERFGGQALVLTMVGVRRILDSFACASM